MTFDTPAHVAGLVDVTVTTPAARRRPALGVHLRAATVAAPTATGIVPNRGSDGRWDVGDDHWYGVRGGSDDGGHRWEHGGGGGCDGGSWRFDVDVRYAGACGWSGRCDGDDSGWDDQSGVGVHLRAAGGGADGDRHRPEPGADRGWNDGDHHRHWFRAGPDHGDHRWHHRPHRPGHGHRRRRQLDLRHARSRARTGGRDGDDPRRHDDAGVGVHLRGSGAAHRLGSNGGVDQPELRVRPPGARR